MVFTVPVRVDDATPSRRVLLRGAVGGAAALATDMALPTSSVSPQAPPSASAAGVPPQPPAALAALLTAEKAGVKAASDACLAAPGWRAPLLGSIAACRASHLDLLT
jgi:hypothetical protein